MTDIDNMTLQERRQNHFNVAWHGVIEQGHPGVRPSKGVCCYITDENPHATKFSQCGVGFILGPDLSREWETRSGGMVEEMIASCIPHSHGYTDDEWGYEHIDKKDRQIIPRWLFEDRQFYADVQRAHDDANDDYGDCPFIDVFKHYMERVASDYGLTVPVTQE